MVSCCVFFSDTLGENLMQVFEDVNREDVFIVSFDNSDWDKVRLEATRSGRLIPVVVLAILTYGIEHYKYTTKKDATY